MFYDYTILPANITTYAEIEKNKNVKRGCSL